MSESGAVTPQSRPSAVAPSLSSAARSPMAWLRFLGIAAVGASLDLWTKHWVFSHLGYGIRSRHLILIPGVLMLQTTLNGGAVFGIGDGLSLLFIAVSFIAIAFVVYVFVSSHRHHRLVHIALGLILAGAIGNLYDRIFNHGMVRDFIMLRYWPFDFNLADSMLCVGVPLLVLCWLRAPRSPGQAAPPPENRIG